MNQTNIPSSWEQQNGGRASSVNVELAVPSTCDAGQAAAVSATAASTNRRFSRGMWTPEEDARLSQIVDWYNDSGQRMQWQMIALAHGHGRTNKQCRERWNEQLRPNVKKGNWSVEEMQAIDDMYRAMGSKWSVMAKVMKNRTANAIKNKWYSMQRAICSAHRKSMRHAQRYARILAQQGLHELPAQLCDEAKETTRAAEMPEAVEEHQPSQGLDLLSGACSSDSTSMSPIPWRHPPCTSTTQPASKPPARTCASTQTRPGKARKKPRARIAYDGSSLWDPNAKFDFSSWSEEKMSKV